MRAALITHTHPEVIRSAVEETAAFASKQGWQLLSDFPAWAQQPGITMVSQLPMEVDLCLVLGGDGSILYALRQYANSDVPVFGINHGTVGFLSAAERLDNLDALERAFQGDYETVSLPALRTADNYAFNDIALVRPQGSRIAELHYQVAGEEVGGVRCDGLVVATPTGSTGYNLANNGPILAWGVQGYVVSYISPHSLTARPLVVAPDETLVVSNAPGRQDVNIEIDGGTISALQSGEKLEIAFVANAGLLAQLPEQSFYRRIENKFGHLAN